MTSTRSALDADWLAVCRRAAAGLERMLAEVPTTEERAQETGTRGSGGDRTLEIDQTAEQLVFDELDGLRDEGYQFCALSEERGVIDYGDHDVRVIIDPIDGSLNAKRGVPTYALSIAVADGPTMADVVFGFVHDFGAVGRLVGVAGPGRLAGRRRARSHASRAPRPRRAARGPGHRIRRPPLDRGFDRRPPGQRLPPARARHDRRLALPGGRGALRRHGVAAALPRSRRRRRSADRARGGRLGQLPLVRSTSRARRSPPSRPRP